MKKALLTFLLAFSITIPAIASASNPTIVGEISSRRHTYHTRQALLSHIITDFSGQSFETRILKVPVKARTLSIHETQATYLMDCFADVLFERCLEYWAEQVVVKFEGGNIAVPIILHKQKAPRVVSDVDEGVFQYSDLSL